MSEDAFIMPDDDAPPPAKVKAIAPPVEPQGDGLGSGIMEERGHEKGDIRMAQMAINRGWPVDAARREKVMARAEKILDKTHVVVGVDADGQPIVSDAKADELALRAGQLILAADNHNQADRHLEDKNARLDSGKATENITERVITVEFDKRG